MTGVICCVSDGSFFPLLAAHYGGVHLGTCTASAAIYLSALEMGKVISIMLWKGSLSPSSRPVLSPLAHNSCLILALITALHERER